MYLHILISIRSFMSSKVFPPSPVGFPASPGEAPRRQYNDKSRSQTSVRKASFAVNNSIQRCHRIHTHRFGVILNELHFGKENAESLEISKLHGYALSIFGKQKRHCQESQPWSSRLPFAKLPSNFYLFATLFPLFPMGNLIIWKLKHTNSVESLNPSRKFSFQNPIWMD